MKIKTMSLTAIAGIVLFGFSISQAVAASFRGLLQTAM